MELTIKSKKLGRIFTFSRPGKAHIFCDLGKKDKIGTLGYQICKGGNLRGTTIACESDDQKAFEAICRTWYKAYLKAELY